MHIPDKPHDNLSEQLVRPTRYAAIVRVSDCLEQRQWGRERSLSLRKVGMGLHKCLLYIWRHVMIEQ